MKIRNSVVAAAGALVLAGCGGSGGDMTEDPDLLDPAEFLDVQLNAPTTVEIVAERSAYINDFRTIIQNQEFSDLSGLGATGSVTFDGLIGIDEGEVSGIENAEMISRIKFELDLRSNRINGVANSFVLQEDGSEITGDVNFGGFFSRENVLTTGNFGASGALEGELTSTNGNVSSLSGTFAGDFYGDNIDAFDADADGTRSTVSSSGAAVADESYTFDADIITRRAD